jgi:hypothetical protein
MESPQLDNPSRVARITTGTLTDNEWMSLSVQLPVREAGCDRPVGFIDNLRQFRFE